MELHWPWVGVVYRLMAIRQLSRKAAGMERPEWFPRFESYISHEALSGCWLWTGSENFGGYGRFYLHNKKFAAHRTSYELFKGPIPGGLQLDHLCRVRCCVNPDHLEIVTGAENMRRGFSPSGINAKKTHCHRGHPLSGDNIVGTRGRDCRECNNIRLRGQRVKYRATLEKGGGQ